MAIFDDIGAIVIIALFYSSELSFTSLMIAASGVGLLSILNHRNVQNAAAYMLVGIIVWVAVLKSGVHATLAGFLVAWFIPLTVAPNEKESLLVKVEHDLHPCVALFILPIFAFSNAGVNLQGMTFATLMEPITLGIVFGLLLGKQLGVFAACWVTVKMGFAQLPKGTTWRQLYGVSVLCGIGFTMSLFVGTLAFDQNGVSYHESVKLGVLIGSIFSALLGSFLIAQRKQSAVTVSTKKLLTMN